MDSDCDLPPPPQIFVNVASKGVSQSVSLLFATLTGGLISVASKGFRVNGRRLQVGSSGMPPPTTFFGTI